MNEPGSVRSKTRIGRLRASEIATLVGMIGAIGSLYFVWEDRLTPASQRMPIPGALYTDTTHVPLSTKLTGFQTTAHWPLTLFAIGCGMALLVNVTAANRTAVMILHGVCSMAVLVIGMRWFALGGFAPHPGPLAALASAALLTFGTVERYAGNRGERGE